MSIVSRLTTAVKDEIMSSAARAYSPSAFYQDLIDMRRIDGADGLWPKNPAVGDMFMMHDGTYYRFDGLHWVTFIMDPEGP